MVALSKEIAAYKRKWDVVEGDQLGGWALVHDERLVGSFNSLESAAKLAVGWFGRGPYLIRQVGALLSLCWLHCSTEPPMPTVACGFVGGACVTARGHGSIACPSLPTRFRFTENASPAGSGTIRGPAFLKYFSSGTQGGNSSSTMTALNYPTVSRQDDRLSNGLAKPKRPSFSTRPFLSDRGKPRAAAGPRVPCDSVLRTAWSSGLI